MATTMVSCLRQEGRVDEAMVVAKRLLALTGAEYGEQVGGGEG